MTKRTPWGGAIGKPAVLKVARSMQERDGLSWPRALRKALAWARRKAEGGGKPADPHAALRARGIYSPRDRSPEAAAHFGARADKLGHRPNASNAGR
jgi:hypothetical protein